ncbi:uncharacterized protein LOC111395263 [Olea europaea var. sylvestris]|uniref:uncharacterized protein LOC111395263 n=1 Tax=Olea europaea var. sylvestris TaxID=158386 RepID=UPI000C1D8CB3|nr:uncharacterized protein LOC111395263 [Olea europaea var. sylvestris]
MSQSLSVPSYFDGSNYVYWKDELAECNWNSKGLHALFMSVSLEEFRRVSMYETAKEVWYILETTHKGTKTVKNSKFFNLGKRIPESKIVRKVLRSLPERFRPKVTAIEERKDLDTVKIEELVGSLQIDELTISLPRKNKSIALNTVREEKSESSDVETLRDEEIAYFVKKFQKVLKGKKWSQEKKRGAPSKLEREKNDKSTARNPGKKSQVVRCHECQGFGHYRNKCPSFKNNLKKGRSKALAVSLTDDDSNSSEQSDSSSSEEEKGYMAFVSIVKSESDKESEKVEEEVESNKSGDDSKDETDIHEAYQLLFKESLKIQKVNKALFKRVDELEREKEKITNDLQISSKNLSELKCVNEKLEDRVKTLTCELEKSITQLQSFVSGTKKLDDLLGMNKSAGNRQGLGFVKSDGKVSSLSKTTFLPASNRSNISTNPKSKDKNFTGLKAIRAHKISTPKFQDQHSRASEPRFIPTCHHCGALGHTRPRYRKLANRNRSQNIPSQVNFLSNQVSHLTEMFVAHGAYKTQNTCMWYLDSACSKHMCGNKALFSTFDDCNSGVVTFGDGATAPIRGKGSITISGLPTISNVLYVEGLKSNLLSISQICDADYEVSFVQKRCTVYNPSGGIVLKGVRTFDNCYGVLPNSNYVCSSAKIDMSELWHQRLDHVNYRSLSKLVKKKIVDGLPKIDQSENAVCKPYTWIEPLREKSEKGDLVKSLCKRLRIEQNLSISRVRSDHEKEFENFNLENFCLEEGINHEFSSPITLQQNGVVERKNIVLQEMAKDMLHGKDLAMHFWGEAINTTKCYILRDRENLGKFDSKSDDGVFLGYSKNGRAYRVYNLRTQSVLKSVIVVIDDAFTKGESAENEVDIEDLSDDQGATAENKEQSIPKSPRSFENISD